MTTIGKIIIGSKMLREPYNKTEMTQTMKITIEERRFKNYSFDAFIKILKKIQ